ncbi:TonB-dependent siderophore receptor, partial [Pseudomonas coronafaciens pv. garcae]
MSDDHLNVNPSHSLSVLRPCASWLRKPNRYQGSVMPRPASSLHLLALAVLMACAAMPLHAAESSVPNQDVTAARSFSIPAGDLGQVLNSFSEQADLALAFAPALTRGKRSTGLQGTYSTDEAIARLLGGSG